MNTDCINNTINNLFGFNPIWDNDRQVLFYTDFFNGTIFKFDWNNQKTNTGRIHGENQVSFFMPVQNDNNKFVVGVGNRLLLVNWDQNNHHIKVDKVLGQLNDDKIRFTVAKCDKQGRLFLGTCLNEDFGNVYEQGKGGIYRFTMRDGLKKLKDNMGNIFGLAIDNLNKKFFVTDINDMKVKQFDFDDQNGDIKNETTLIDLNNFGQQKKIVGKGMTVDQHGNLYVCMNGNGKILKINTKNRNVDQEIKFQVQNLTNCIFGGRNLDTLIVTTCQIDFDGRQKQDNNNQWNGRLHLVQNMQVQGQKCYKFNKDN